MGWEKEQIKWVAGLAKLGLSPAEETNYAGQLAAILGYVAELQQIDITTVEDVGQITGLTNQLAKDGIKNCEIPREQLLANAPAQEKGYVKVKSIFGRAT